MWPDHSSVDEDGQIEPEVRLVAPGPGSCVDEGPGDLVDFWTGAWLLAAAAVLAALGVGIVAYPLWR
jgi:hypothetical protein